MRLHNLHPIHKGRQSKRVGRGGKKGTYSGRGMKGQKARAGSKSKPRLGFAGGDTLPYKKIPKRRGSRFGFIRKKAKALIGLGTIDKYFKNGEKITPEALLEKGLIKRIGGKIPEVKLLGGGQLTKKLLVENCQVSESAKKAIGNLDSSDYLSNSPKN